MTKPNIIYILADDMGYGDLGCNNPDSQIPTPNLDRLASQGMRFTDAHAGSSVCTPSRYNVLTGRYCWRSRLQQGIVWQWDAPLIEPEQKTVAQLMQEQGYHTKCIGKWHLGWDWAMKDGTHPNEHIDFGVFDDKKREEIGKQIDYECQIKGGPTTRGFDSYFGIDVPNFPPYTWFEDDRLAVAPTVDKPDDIYGHPGMAVPDWELQKMIPEFTRRVVETIEAQENTTKPLFLYFPLTSPHSPVVPNEQFKGMSGAGNYGDFVCEVDWVVGQVCDALERTGLADNTLLIFTSDNGPEDKTRDDIGVYQRACEHEHYSMGDLRGIKRDAWEGGHRVPFIARWPKVTPANMSCNQLTTLGDLMATCAQITETDLDKNDAEDSVSILPLLQGNTDSPVRDYAVHHSCNGKFAIRKGDWILIADPSGDDNVEPDWFRKKRGYEPHNFPAELFNLNTDISERKNCYGEQPEIVTELMGILAQVKRSSHSSGSSLLPDSHLTE
jgi:arylsulfatase A